MQSDKERLLIFAAKLLLAVRRIQVVPLISILHASGAVLSSQIAESGP